MSFISNTARTRYNALRYQGILITDCHAQLAAMLEKNLSPAHALLFAEPVHEASGESTDWYTNAPGDPVLLETLPPEEQEAARRKIASLAADIAALAEELAASPDTPKKIRGNILLLALDYPDLTHVYMLGDQPVITCWGFAPGSLGAQPENLMRLGAAPRSAPSPVAAPVPPPAASPGFGWLRALLFFLLGLLLLLGLFFLAGLLLGPAGCKPPVDLPPGCAATFSGSGCAALPAPTSRNATFGSHDAELLSSLTAEQEKERSLRGQLEDLRKLLNSRAAECPRAVPEPPKRLPDLAEAPPLPEPLTPDPVAPESPAPPAPKPPSIEEMLPTTPEEPEPAPLPETPKPPKPKEPPKEAPKPPKPAKGEELRIPDSAKKNKDVSFLEGCWNSETGLHSDRTGEPIIVQYCFDAKGNGKRTITKKKSNERCVGPVRAQFDAQGRLRLNADSSPCSKGGGFVPQQVDCSSSAGGKAQCYGTEGGNKNRKWQARFKRS